MAKYKAPPPARSAQQKITFTDMEDMPATYADMFMVIAEKTTGMAEIYFFQSQVSVPSMGYGTSHLGARKKAKCVSRIIVSEKGLQVLFKSLEDNRDGLADLQGKEEEEE